MSYTAYKWEGGVPKKVDDVCCDTVEYDKIVVPDLCLYTCQSCGKHFQQPKINFLKVKGNPRFDATIKEKTTGEDSE